MIKYMIQKLNDGQMFNGYSYSSSNYGMKPSFSHEQAFMFYSVEDAKQAILELKHNFNPDIQYQVIKVHMESLI